MKVLFGLLVVGILALGFFIAYLSLNMAKVFVKNPLSSPTPNSYIQATAKPASEVQNQKGIYNILFLGYGGKNHEGSLLTDSIIVVHIDTNNKAVDLISIPRDLWYLGNHKINAEGSINGFANVGSSIKNITGLFIGYFISVDFDGFTNIIDTLGGIVVNNPKTFDDSFYPITGQENNVCGKTEAEIQELKTKYSGYNLETQFTCRYEHVHFNQGQVNLDGATALKFVRSRHGDSDFGRSLRQFAVLQGIGNKLVSFQIANRLDSIINSLSQMVRTDLDAGTLKTLIQILGDPKVYKLKQIQLTTDNVLTESKSADGAYILVPKSGNTNFSEIQNFINTNLN